MSLAPQLGLHDVNGEVLVAARSRWARWQEASPALEVCDDFWDVGGGYLVVDEMDLLTRPHPSVPLVSGDHVYGLPTDAVETGLLSAADRQCLVDLAEVAGRPPGWPVKRGYVGFLMHIGHVGVMALRLGGCQAAGIAYEVPPQDLPVLLHQFPAIPSSTFVAARPTGLATDTHGA